MSDKDDQTEHVEKIVSQTVLQDVHEDIMEAFNIFRVYELTPKGEKEVDAFVQKVVNLSDKEYESVQKELFQGFVRLCRSIKI